MSLLTALGFVFPPGHPSEEGHSESPRSQEFAKAGSLCLAVLGQEEDGHTMGQTQSLCQLCRAPRAVTACPLLPQHFMAQTRVWDKKIRSERCEWRAFLLPSTPSREGFRSVFSPWKRSGPAHGCQGRALCSPSTDSAFLWKSCNSRRSLRSTRKLLILLEIP